jgi:hypothetical protein
MLQHLTGGAWGLIIRRPLEAATRTLPLMAILFLPIFFGLSYIYPWTDRAAMEQIESVREKVEHYLNPGFFRTRAALYFVFWALLALSLNWLSAEQDRNPSSKLGKRLQMISGPGLALLILSITFAAIDWVMSLEPAWYSTIYGLIFVASWSLSALSLTIVVMSWLSRRAPMDTVVQRSHFHDWGILLLTLAIVILQFAFPFMTLLSRAAKKSSQKLAQLALLILIMRVLDVIWLIKPAFNPGSFNLSWMDVVAPIAIGGLWLAFYAWQLQQRSLLPINDPQLEQALEAHAEH